MISVGVGVAPMIQALEKVLHTPGDNTKVKQKVWVCAVLYKITLTFADR